MVLLEKLFVSNLASLRVVLHLVYLSSENVCVDHITQTRPCNIQRFLTVVKMTIFSLIFFTIFIFSYIVGTR